MDFGAWVQTWLNVTTKPGVQAFEEERAKPQATLQTALIWVVLAALISGILGWIAAQFIAAPGITSILNQVAAQADLPPEVAAQLQGGAIPFLSPAVTLWGAILGIVWTIIGFLIGVGILHLVARVLGGTGSYGRYAYLLASFYVPITIVSALVGLVPFVGGCVTLIISIYGLVLAYFATMAEQKLSSGKSIVVVIAPVLAIFLCVLCFFTFAAATLFSIFQAGQ